MNIRDRIKELRRVPARDLLPNPRNWRRHPPSQQDALRGMLAEVGYAAALVARELDGGELMLIDGHLRAETTPDSIVPVLVLDVSEAESHKLLAALDPLSAAAAADSTALDELLRDVHTENEALAALLAELSKSSVADDAAETPSKAPVEPSIPTLFQVVAECRDEQQQQTLYEQLTSEGYRCRVLCM